MFFLAPILAATLGSPLAGASRAVPLSEGVARLGDLSPRPLDPAFVRAWRAYSAGRHDRAATAVLLAARERYPGLRDHIGAALGDILWKQRRKPEASAYYSRVRAGSHPFARACQRSGRHAADCRAVHRTTVLATREATATQRRTWLRRKEFERAVATFPFSYEGHRSRLALSHHDRVTALLASVGALPFLPTDPAPTAFETLAPEPRFPESDFTDPRLEAAVEWWRLGMKTEAERDLRAVETDMTTSEGTFVHLARVFADIGQTRRAHWVLRLRCDEYARMRDARLRDRLLKIAYPTRFEREVAAAAYEYGIPVALFYSLIREESSFNPRAVSVADALGLTQVVWATASDMARALGVKKLTRAAIFDPKLNLRMGARFLRWLIDYFEGRVPLAVAAYNAGPGNVDKWLRVKRVPRVPVVHAAVDIDRFVDAIPFAETRAYVQRVLGGSEAYATIYGLKPL